MDLEYETEHNEQIGSDKKVSGFLFIPLTGHLMEQHNITK
jgi:hypothetical protein